MQVIKSDGKAHITGTRIRVMDIAERYTVLKERPEDIAQAFGLPIQAIFSALAYYYQHLEEIHEEIAQDKEFVKKVRSQMKAVVYAT